MRGWPVALALACLILASASPFAGFWKSSLPLHMLVQFPLLVVAGALVGCEVARWRSVEPGAYRLEGLSAVLFGAFVLSFWMLPRWLDAAVLDWRIDVAKVISLALVVGLSWGWGWQQIGTLTRGFLAIHGISMLFALGILYRSTPVRLCNTYLLDQQSILGGGMLAIAAIATVLAALRLMAGNSIVLSRSPGASEVATSL